MEIKGYVIILDKPTKKILIYKSIDSDVNHLTMYTEPINQIIHAEQDEKDEVHIIV